jgi:hypothetical protein
MTVYFKFILIFPFNYNARLTMLAGEALSEIARQLLLHFQTPLATGKSAGVGIMK